MNARRPAVALGAVLLALVVGGGATLVALQESPAEPGLGAHDGRGTELEAGARSEDAGSAPTGARSRRDRPPPTHAPDEGAEYTPRTVYGFVTDDDNEGLAGAAITLTRAGYAPLHTRSDEDGYFDFEDVAPGAWRFRAAHPAFPPWSADVEASVETLNVTLLDAFTIDVVVHDPHSDLCEVVAVAVSRHHPRGFETTPELVEPASQTQVDDTTERFQLRLRPRPGAPIGPRRIWVRTDDGRAGSSGWLKPEGAEKRAQVRITIPAGRSVTGVVVTPAGAPVEAAHIFPSPVPGPAQPLAVVFWTPGVRHEADTETDAGGRFALRLPSDGHYELMVLVGGRGSTVISVPLEPTPLRIVSPPAPDDVTILGRVLDPEGRPLGGVDVVLNGPLDGLRRIHGIDPLPADETGRFVSEGILVPGRYAARVMRDGIPLGNAEIVLKHQRIQDVELRLARLRRLAELRLRITKDGEPLALAKTVVVSMEHANARSTGTTDLDGRVAVTVAPAAQYVVGLPGASETRWRLVQHHPDAGEFALELGPGLSLAGTLLDGDGRPFDLARVWLTVIGGRGDTVRGFLVADSPRRRRDGRFSFQGLAPGRYWIEVQEHNNWRPVHRAGPVMLSSDVAVGAIRVKEPGVIDVRVVDDAERPLFGVRVLTHPVGDSEDVTHTTSGPDGRAIIPDVGPGPMRVAVRRDGRVVWARTVEVPAGGTAWTPVTLR